MLLIVPAIRARQLPGTTFTVADGLRDDLVGCIVPDSRGFIWFCTLEGLARFDGYQFTNHSVTAGLASRPINQFLETRSGAYLIASGAGITRFRGPAASLSGAAFTTYSPAADGKPQAVTAILENHRGTVWAASNGRIYRLDGIDDLKICFRPVDSNDYGSVQELIEDRRGALWVATTKGLYRRTPDGHVDLFTVAHGLPSDAVSALLEDHQGRVWVGTDAGLCRLAAGPNSRGRIVEQTYGIKQGLMELHISSLLESSSGTLWVGTVKGLAELRPGKDADHSFEMHRAAQGFTDRGVWALAEDGGGNLWVGTEEGAKKVAVNGFTTVTEAEGMGRIEVPAVFQDRHGDLFAITKPAGTVLINRFDGRLFTAIKPRYPRAIKYTGWGSSQIALHDRFDEWWIATGSGLCRFPRVERVDQLAHTPPKVVYTTRDGLASDMVFRIFEDSRSDIWIATASPSRNGLSRWIRDAAELYHYGAADGIPDSALATVFREDGGGNVWIGFNGAGLARYRDGRFEFFHIADGVPRGWIQALHVDGAGRLWVAADGGVSRVDQLSVSHPHFTSYSVVEGLSSNSAKCLAEDRWGRIYIGNRRGVDRLDPSTGHVKHYGTAEGLVPGDLQAACSDRRGSVWFASVYGLSELMPAPDRSRRSPAIFITSVTVAGRRQHLAEIGETRITLVDISPADRQLEFGFVGPSTAGGDLVRYQHMLQPADQNWSPPNDDRAITYANLPAGNYRFRVRAVTSDGAPSATPATIDFVVPAPVWRRPWFLALLAGLGAAFLYRLERGRIMRAVEVERVRSRIATDLHDDIGSSLSQIVILCELATRRAVENPPELTGALREIAGTSRDLIDAMSDIVWAIDPERDRVSDLAQRMRWVAGEILDPRNVKYEFRGPAEERSTPLPADTRRQVFLIFKEGLYNAARHASCSKIMMELRIETDGLELTVSDDGRGFDPSQRAAGHGLRSMRQRAAAMGGTLEIVSGAARGTVLRLKAPLRRSSGRWAWILHSWVGTPRRRAG